MDDPGDALPSPLCVVVDHDPAVGRLIALAAAPLGLEVLTLPDVAAMNARLGAGSPDLIFLDVSLGAADAIEAIRALAARQSSGPVQLMSDRDAMLLADVWLIGERYGLRMLPVLRKPLAADAIARIIAEEAPFAPEYDARAMA